MTLGHKKELVIQLPATFIEDYDTLIELENVIAAGIGTSGKVDGHDMGSGEMNIFIRTDHPELIFKHIKSLLGTKDFMPELKAALRDVGQDNFTILFPPSLTKFKLA